MVLLQQQQQKIDEEKDRGRGRPTEKPKPYTHQAIYGSHSLTMVIPKYFGTELGIKRGDYVKCHLEDNRLIVEKVQ